MTALKLKISPVNDVLIYEQPNTTVKKVICLDDVEEWKALETKLKENALDYAGIETSTNYEVQELNFTKLHVKLKNPSTNTTLYIRLEKLECLTVKASILMSYITNLKDLFEKKYSV